MYDYIKNELHIENYILKLENGKIVKTKDILVFDDSLKNLKNLLTKEKDFLIILLEQKESNINNLKLNDKFSLNSKNEIEWFNDYAKNINSNYNFDTIKIYYEQTLKIIENSQKIQTQNNIHEFYDKFYNNEKIIEINIEISKIKDFISKMKNFKNNEITENLITLKNQFRNLEFCNIKITDLLQEAKIFNVNLIDEKSNEFNKSLKSLEDKINNLENNFVVFKKNLNDLFSNFKPETLSDELQNLIKNDLKYFVTEIKKRISINIQDKNEINLFKNLIESFTTFWDNSDVLDKIFKIVEFIVKNFFNYF